MKDARYVSTRMLWRSGLQGEAAVRDILKNIIEVRKGITA